MVRVRVNVRFYLRFMVTDCCNWKPCVEDHGMASGTVYWYTMLYCHAASMPALLATRNLSVCQMREL